VNSESDLFHEELTFEQIDHGDGGHRRMPAAHLPGPDETTGADARVLPEFSSLGDTRRGSHPTSYATATDVSDEFYCIVGNSITLAAPGTASAGR
jgi:hypothetical protein